MIRGGATILAEGTMLAATAVIEKCCRSVKDIHLLQSLNELDIMNLKYHETLSINTCSQGLSRESHAQVPCGPTAGAQSSLDPSFTKP